MFEESLKETEFDSPRKFAQFRHCRLRKIVEGDTIHQGICVCECPAECRFPFPQRDLPNAHLMFEDVREFYWQLATE